MLRIPFLALVALISLESFSQAQVVVWVDFTSDMHDGGAGGPNGISDWVDELSKVSSLAGVTAFSASEQSVIEGKILDQLSTIFSGYSVTFTTSVPGSSPFDAIAYGKNTTGFSSLGVAPTDPGNILSGQVASVGTGNFDFILDEFTGSAMRSMQIDQLSTALAGTGAHELGHSLGLFHQHAYSHPRIGPGNYLATAGLQNSHIMATGPTGLGEAGREVLRHLGPWERAMMDIAGGASAAYPTSDHHKMVSSPVMIDLTEDGAFDAGSTFGSALGLTLSAGETSGMDLAFAAGDIDMPMDTDMFSFTIDGPGRLMAEIFSSNRFGAPFNFDAELTLFDPFGIPIATNDKVFFTGDMFGVGPLIQSDPFLLNITLPVAGTYFISVAGSMAPMVPMGIGDAYWLLLGITAIPEPGIAAVLLAAALVVARQRRRRR